MKKVFFLSFCLLSFFSCTNEKQNVAVVSASISNPKGENIALYSHDWKEIKKLHLNDGNFTDTIIHPEGKYYLSNGNDFAIPLYLSKGYRLHLTFDREHPDNFTFSGKGALANDYLSTKSKEDKTFRTESREIFKLNEQEFLQKIDDFSSNLRDALTKVTDDPDFVAKQQKEIEYTSVLQIDAYEKLHANLIGDSQFKTSDNFPNTIQNIDLNNEDEFKEIEAYKALIVTNFFNSIEKESKTTQKSEGELAVQKLSTMKEGEIRDFLILLTTQWIGAYSTETAPLYQKLVQLLKNQEEKAKIEDIISNFKKLEVGKASPAFFNLESIDDKTYSLVDFKGKFVYIDVWATWCGPCRGELPHLKALEHSYKDKNIVFVSISVDKDKDAWKKMVTEQQLSGIQLYEDSEKSSFTKEYQVNSIPRFILIGKNGEIISADAPRPSEKEKIEELFKKNGI